MDEHVFGKKITPIATPLSEPAFKEVVGMTEALGAIGAINNNNMKQLEKI